MSKDDAMVYATIGCIVGGMILLVFHLIAGVCTAGLGYFLLGKLAKGGKDGI